MPKCLITGASGFLGREVGPRLARDFTVSGLSHTQAGPGLVQADLRDAENLRQVLSAEAPDVVVHLAAYREPDFCEEHPEEAHRLNVAPVQTMCESLPSSARLVYISTDYVFDGENPPYRETDPPSPVSVYGSSKLDGERLALAREGGLALRIPLLIGAGPSLGASGFIGQMHAAVLDQQPLELDDVLIRFPTWTRDVAEAVAFLLAREETGLFHCSGLRGTTRYAWTMELAEILRAPSGHLSPASAVAPRPARRPPNSQLLPEKLQSLGYTRFTDFADVVRDVLGTFA